MASSPQYPIKKVEVTPPSLPELATAIASGLSSNFAQAMCEVSTPPDLTQAPYHLAGPGLSGSPRVIDVGGPPYLIPSPDLKRQYDLQALASQTGMSSKTGFILGAGAGPLHILGVNSEWIPNFAYGTAAGGPGKLRSRTRYAKINSSMTASCCSTESTGFGLMSNLFGSDGTVGPCLHLKVKGRTGKLNLPEAIQKGLTEAFGEKFISLGGVFVVTKGQVYLHVAPDFPEEPFGDYHAVDRWLKYFHPECGPESGEGPLVCLTVMHNGDDGGLGVRKEHSHCYTVVGDGIEDSNKGGHYHYDMDETKDEVEYEAWLNVAEAVFRVDAPPPGYAAPPTHSK